MFAGLGVGPLLILLALALLMPVLAIVASRRASRNASFVPQNDPSLSPPDSTKIGTEAILLIQAGGRVEYVNELARAWFGLSPAEVPDLERLIRRTRPAEEFLNLCATPGKKRLSIGSQLVEATSYPLPGNYAQMLVALKPVEFSRNLPEAGNDSSILRLVSDFGRDVSASLALTDVLHAVLLNVSQLIASDLLEVKAWDASSKTLTSFILDPTGGSGIQSVSLSQFTVLTDHLLKQRKPLLVTDTRTSPSGVEDLNGNYPVKSYLGLPLVADNQLVGTLELGHLAPGRFGHDDLDLGHVGGKPQCRCARRGVVARLGAQVGRRVGLGQPPAPHPPSQHSPRRFPMANLSADFIGIKSPNPFWLASAPPTDKEYNVRRAFEAGWGGVVTKTIGLHPVVNVRGPKTKFLRADHAGPREQAFLAGVGRRLAGPGRSIQRDQAGGFRKQEKKVCRKQRKSWYRQPRERARSGISSTGGTYCSWEWLFLSPLL